MVQNISATLSSFNGTLLERLESYVRTTKYPLRSNQTIENVARAIYSYIIHRKPVGFQEMIYERLGEEPDTPTLTNGLQGQSIFSNGYTRTEHTKPTVVVSSPDSLEVSLDGVTKLSDEVFIHYHKTGSRERGELVVPGGTPTAVITGLTPGTTYYVEIHGVVKGRSSKSYSFVTSTGTRVCRMASLPGCPALFFLPATIPSHAFLSPNSNKFVSCLHVAWELKTYVAFMFARKFLDTSLLTTFSLFLHCSQNLRCSRYLYCLLHDWYTVFALIISHLSSSQTVPSLAVPEFVFFCYTTLPAANVFHVQSVSMLSEILEG